jgi:hypothetical protein
MPHLPANLFSSPDLSPLQWDADTRRLYFIPMSRVTYRLSSFLDERAVRLPQLGYEADLGHLEAQAGSVPAYEHPVHYVLHGALCCSTLLTRYLDLLPHSFVLREPGLLTQIAGRKLLLDAGGDGAGWDAETWSRLFQLCMRFLERRYTAEDTVIIKPNDWCNTQAARFLQWDSRSRIVFLSHPLREFVLSALKWPQRREWLRGRALKVANVVDVRLAQRAAGGLQDAELAALLWLAYNGVCRDILRADPGRVLPVDGREVAALSPQTLGAVSCFLGFAPDEDQLGRFLDDPSLRRHAKDLAVGYDAEVRRADLAAVNVRFGAEAEQGIAWARRVCAELGLEPVFRLE